MILGSAGLINDNPGGGASADGVLFNFPTGQQYTSYRTGDEGWRVQNGFYNITKPSYPSVISILDYTMGASYWYVLKTALSVGGVKSTTRFVDVNGVQVWGAANNVRDILIDKFTGLGWLRNLSVLTPADTWDNSVDAALVYSTTVQGVTYSDFYLPSLEEMLLLGAQFNNLTWTDPVTGQSILYNVIGSVDMWTSTTVPIATAAAYDINPNPDMLVRGIAKSSTFANRIYVFDARSLITA